ncbi:unnamed protein product [Meloidogyne enterolobii]|uniref:Uncharacterized protein n=1 Tax=Meloidogyne enterolobii TaxID=390850 RepID=A0ACB1AM06_MELEN
MDGQRYKIILFNVILNEKNEPQPGGQEIGTKFSQKYDTVTFKLSKEWVESMEVYEEDTGHFKYKKNNQFSIYVFGHNENVWGFLVRYLRVENGLDQNLSRVF